MKNFKIYFAIVATAMTFLTIGIGIATSSQEPLPYTFAFAALALFAWIASAFHQDRIIPENIKIGKGEGDGESPRPDLVATRSFVQESLNKSLANVMHVNGSTHKFINDRLSRLERLNRQGGYLAFYYPKSVHELNFKEFCGTLHVGENGECYSLYDIKLDGKTIVSATIVPSDHAGLKSNAEANYDLVCNHYFGRGSEMCDEIDISKELAESMIATYKSQG